MVGNEDRPSVAPPVADGDVYPFADVQAVAASRLAPATSASAYLMILFLRVSLGVPVLPALSAQLL